MYQILVIWIVSGILTYGLLVGHFQGKYPTLAYDNRISDRVFAFIMCLAGPLGLLAWFIICDHWEWRL